MFIIKKFSSMEMINQAHSLRMESSNLGLVMFLVSIWLGPISTIVAGVMSKDEACKKAGIIVGVLQYLLIAFFGIGYFWGIFNGFKIWQNSK